MTNCLSKIFRCGTAQTLFKRLFIRIRTTVKTRNKDGEAEKQNLAVRTPDEARTIPERKSAESFILYSFKQSFYLRNRLKREAV
jgi:hypothetical protein